ncbi:MAG TPA: transglutaminase family protein, partial [Chitinophagales bacterium]|nr:transglutaminase family protein [Chitinophagales bacterium]
MTAINLSEFKALVSLLDDDDNEVFTHVSNKLVSFGKEGLSLLESAWEAEENIVIQEKLESLIKKIQYDNIKDRLKQWLESDEQDLLEAALIVNTIEYPEIDELAIIDKINSIAKSVWIELNAALSPLEELQVMNQVFYQLHGFFSNNDKNTFKQIPDLGNLNKILETKNGNSISLGILFLII